MATAKSDVYGNSKRSSRFCAGIAVPAIFAAMMSVANGEPVIRYVAPGGSGDGTSWENASGSITNMYAEVGANADGGEVRIRSGLYQLEAPITMLPGVKVVGGFEGTTIISGDRGTANYWQKNNSGNLGLVVQEGTVYLPDPPANPTGYISGYDPSVWSSTPDVVHGFELNAGEAANCAFENLTFVSFRKAAIFVSSASADGLRIENCSFFGCNNLARSSSTADYGVVDVSDCSVSVSNCLFKYNDMGVRIGGTEIKRSYVTDSTFFNNHVKQQYSSPQHGGSGGVCTTGKALVDIVGCTFERGGCTEGNNFGKPHSAGGVAINSGASGQTNMVRNCLFKGGFTTHAYGTTGGLLATHTGTLIVDSCRFEGQRSELNGVNTGAAALELGVDDNSFGGYLIVRNSYFGDNVYTNAAATSRTGGSVFAQVTGTAVFINCTMENNLITVPNSGSSVNHATIGIPPGSKTAFVHCLFRNNRAFGKDGRVNPEIGRNDTYNSSDLAIVNCIMDSDRDDFKPFPDQFLSQKACVMAASVIKNFNWGEDFSVYSRTNCTDYGCLVLPVKPVSELSPSVMSSLRVKDGLKAGSVTANSEVRKIGVPVYLGSNGHYFIRCTDFPYSASKPWVRLTMHQGKFTDADVGLVNGVSQPVPDAFGQPRTIGRISLGPLNALEPGTQVIIR